MRRLRESSAKSGNLFSKGNAVYRTTEACNPRTDWKQKDRRPFHLTKSLPFPLASWKISGAEMATLIAHVYGAPELELPDYTAPIN